MAFSRLFEASRSLLENEVLHDDIIAFAECSGKDNSFGVEKGLFTLILSLILPLTRKFLALGLKQSLRGSVKPMCAVGHKPP